MDEQKRVLTAQEVAGRLRVNVYTVHELLRQGKIRGFKILTHWRIPETELDRFMNLETKGGGSDAGGSGSS